MDASNFVEPTTILGLAGLAILAVVYIANRFTNQTSEVIQKNTEILVGVGESIKNYSKSNEEVVKSVKELINLHLKK